MQLRPLPPEISDISSNGWPSHGKHTCGDTEPKREEIWNDYLQMESLTC